MPLRHVLVALLVASRVATLEAWGSSGHEIVGQVAEELLSEGGKGYVANILGNESLGKILLVGRCFRLCFALLQTLLSKSQLGATIILEESISWHLP